MNNRYSRQELFSGIGPSGQGTLFKKHVLIIGAGALGSGSAEALVRAGIGKVTIVDRDYVEWSNLQRQQLYTEQDAEERIPKAAAAQRRLKKINSSVTIEAIIEDAGVEELEKLQKDVDLIIDATDNFETRMIINDISQKYGIPWVYGACVGSYGISYTIIPGKTPCLHCLMESVPLGGATCDTAGIIGPAVGMVVSYQTAEALKLLVGDLGSLRTKLVTFDLWSNQHSAISPQGLKKKECLSCGSKPSYPFLNYENQTKTAVLCGRNSVQIRPAGKVRRDLDKAANRLAKTGGKIERNPFLLSFEIFGNRLVLFQDGRVLIHGISDISEAKKIYHRYLG
ncbi:thiazole biosynthesis adenylyltransferase ThiF [Rossellomorea vietnamensis]|uniref:Thiazole biosynthesis adenylyltransferase ThiF n=1 Tax=Rossellomorea vietnamensis TaxID=218284 RepID=A0A5D4NKT4_9BACI|nr:thiazole biosynthesis adenylyltransferase ThiF [Rossellomorea vietnamensis]TYS13532.1 thiazole biosynthesis adenylyltransferase ThiF [Rossellomorea vietnamensis]